MPITAIANGEAGSIVRPKLNQLIAYGNECLHASDFGLVASQSVDQTDELLDAWDAASTAQVPLQFGQGQYRYTGPISMDDFPNLHVRGPGGSSCTVLAAIDTAGLDFSPTAPDFVFHGSFTNMGFTQLGTAAPYVMSFGRCYSQVFDNCRIFEPDADCTDAMVVFEANNLDLFFTNLICQNPSPQQSVGMRFKNGCGTIRFIKLDMEGCGRNIRHEGGRVELYLPYMESGGVHSIEHIQNVADTTSYFKCFGGSLGSAAGAVGIGFRSNSHDVDYFGTHIFGSTSNDVFVYDAATLNRCNFNQCKLDYTKVNGTDAHKVLGLNGRRLVGSKTHDWGAITTTPETTTVTVTGARVGIHRASAFMSIDQAGLCLNSWVSSDDTVTVLAFSPGGGSINIGTGTLTAVCDIVPIR